MPEKVKLVLLSFACCNPKFAGADKQYLERIKEAGTKMGLEFQIDIVHATEVMMAPDHFPWMRDALPLFMKYGSAIAPALFINEKLELYGGVPTLDRLMEAIKKHVA